jgi:hypothetical protein
MCVCLAAMLPSCATMETMDLARENKRKGGQLAYLLLPITIPLDTVTLPAQAFLVGKGLERGP